MAVCLTQTVIGGSFELYSFPAYLDHKYSGEINMEHSFHEDHTHVHSSGCGHTKIQHGDHFDYLHHGHLHAEHDSHYDECFLEVSDANPDVCSETACQCDHNDCGHEKIRHSDHFDFLVNGRLHHLHNGHCDDHGAVTVL